ncbi:MAG: RNA 2',3'-cyclic phosphodiesterase [Actinomycetota bacterium]
MARDRAARPEARPLRLFVAVDMPDDIRNGLAGAVEPLRDDVPGARWTRPDAWHVTMKFLGGVYPRLRQRVEGAAAEAASAAEPFATRLTELGAFPSPRRARVLWAGLEDPDGRFAELARALDGLLQPEFAPEKRPFTPHLTLARFKEQAPIPEGSLAVHVASEAFPVDRLVLYRSHLQRPAAWYEPLASFPLGTLGERPRRGSPRA